MGNFVNFLRTDLFAIVACFFLLTIWNMLPWIHDPSKQQTTAAVKSEGVLIFEIEWEPAKATDIDLWVRAPDQPPVGYSNKGARNCNLLRDDLGNEGDPTSGNHEMTTCRELTDGRWVANLHFYGGTDLTPTKVYFRVRILRDKTRFEDVYSRWVALVNRQEDTAVRFRLKGGEVSEIDTLRESFNLVQKTEEGR